MILRYLSGTLLIISIVSCSGWNSELDTALIEDKVKDDKPHCDFEVQNNCFNQSIALLRNCLPAVTDEPELLTTDKASCKTASGKQINFLDNSLNAIVLGVDRPLHFVSYNGQKPCFEFVGTADHFIIDSADYGTMSVEALPNGDSQVNCFFNNSFIIKKDSKLRGCRGQKAAPLEIEPRFQLSFKKEKDNSGTVVFDHFQFFFTGAGVSTEPLFRCQN